MRSPISYPRSCDLPAGNEASRSRSRPGSGTSHDLVALALDPEAVGELGGWTRRLSERPAGVPARPCPLVPRLVPRRAPTGAAASEIHDHRSPIRPPEPSGHRLQPSRTGARSDSVALPVALTFATRHLSSVRARPRPRARRDRSSPPSLVRERDHHPAPSDRRDATATGR